MGLTRASETGPNAENRDRTCHHPRSGERPTAKEVPAREVDSGEGTLTHHDSPALDRRPPSRADVSPARKAPDKEETVTEKIRIEQHSFGGMLWFGGWLFTLGLLELHFWRGVLGLLIWPYYLGSALTHLLGGG